MTTAGPAGMKIAVRTLAIRAVPAASRPASIPRRTTLKFVRAKSENVGFTMNRDFSTRTSNILNSLFFTREFEKLRGSSSPRGFLIRIEIGELA
ncbi:unnamed protein product [Nesidiocoris tenuis]|uniref:Uncharacterized protein n=1 Tax=Nesidiocoris tenuis TaxID=355587 RepID=A0A6H5FUK6_9HEMI|nr:unnamed protein product [Nesidiocoris tenuis]